MIQSNKDAIPSHHAQSLQTSIALQFIATAETYNLQWKEHPVDWNRASSRQVEGGSGTVKTEVEDLEPGTTYCLRLVDADGSPGPELVIDTEQVGCTPKADRNCCTVS